MVILTGWNVPRQPKETQMATANNTNAKLRKDETETIIRALNEAVKGLDRRAKVAQQSGDRELNSILISRRDATTNLINRLTSGELDL